MMAGKRAILLAGDAAGQVKATTGGGIFFGASCGKIAGKYSSEPEKYEQEWRRAYGLDLALHRKLRTALDFAGGAPPVPLVSAAKALFFQDLLSERGKMDRWGQMATPSTISAYLKLVAKKVSRG